MDDKGILIAARMDKAEAIELARGIFDFLRERGEKVYYETRLSPKFDGYHSKSIISATNDIIKFIIVIGGDGSVMRVASAVNQENPPPIFGVNIGSIGFLDETNEIKVFKDLEKVLQGDYIIEEVSKITAYLIKSNSEKSKLRNALNEVLIVSSTHSKVLQVSIKINGVYLNRSYLDGVIICTSTGSTAYNLSAGGAIVFPTLDVLQITSLNAFGRSGLKPIVVPIDSEIEIKLLRPRLNAKVIIDGRHFYEQIQPNTRIIVTKANSSFRFIRLSKDLDKSYFKRLKKKIIGALKVPLQDSPEE
ncbi:MAG: NAD(+)/NADH kinase [Promethearchaeota archaeon]|nr:MAG: NAD(+)/NADH kinase [Candidatus Lokiarchaeota archaeon]